MRILEKTENSLESVTDEVGSSYSRTLSIECLQPGNASQLSLVKKQQEISEPLNMFVTKKIGFSFLKKSKVYCAHILYIAYL